MKASVVERTEQCHLRSVSTVLASLPGSQGKQRGSNYVQHERYSYLQEAKSLFEAGHSVSLVLDGVQLGDPILNSIAWDCKSKQGCILPPQALFLPSFFWFLWMKLFFCGKVTLRVTDVLSLYFYGRQKGAHFFTYNWS